MKGYVLAIAGCAILTSILSMLCVNTRQKKIMDGILRLCLLLCIVSPMLGFFSAEERAEITASVEIRTDENYLKKSYALAVNKTAEKEYGITTQTTVETEELKISKIIIFIVDFGMNGKDEHINIMTSVRDRIKVLCDCPNVEVYDDENILFEE